jgi:Zn-dependent protease
MPDQNLWSTSVGRWLGVNVRVHALLVIGIVLLLALEANQNRVSNSLFQLPALLFIFLAMISLLIHEFAHVFAVNATGGKVNDVMLMPWGGGTELAPKASPGNRALIYAAGPAANATIFLLFGFLLTQTNHADWIELMHPMRPILFEADNAQVSTLRILAWINFQLTLINLIPCFPFDGAQLFRALAGRISPNAPSGRVDSSLCMFGNMVGVGSVALAFCAWENALGPQTFSWFVMLLGGIALVYASHSSFYRKVHTPNVWQEIEPELSAEDLSEAHYHHFDLSEESENAIYSQWLQEKQEERLQRLMLEEEQEDRLADQILAKLHDNGFVSLTAEEKELLDRVSARIRKRRQQGV